MGKLRNIVLGTVGAAVLTGMVIHGANVAERQSMDTIEQGVMDFCGDENHVDKVQKYYQLQMGWNREPDSAKQLVKRHERICPGKGIDYPSAVDNYEWKK